MLPFATVYFFTALKRLIKYTNIHAFQTDNINSTLVSSEHETVWNALPESVRSAETLASFKRKLKTYLFNISF